MQVKKYQANTIKEAISRVKDVLGPEAMIVSTKKVAQKPEKNLFEVTAVPAGNDSVNPHVSPLEELKSELMSIKEMISLLDHSGGLMEELMINPALINLYARLIRNGVQEEYARSFLIRTGAPGGFSPGKADSVLEGIIEEIKRVISISDPFQGTDQNRIVAAFIGTTGVGKTTTIAKLAATLMLRRRKSVGLMSIDNYRIGAMEQIKTYGKILGIPCFPAFNRKDLLFALQRMENMDVVLIDTAGQSQYDMSRLGELRTMMPADLSIDSHLVLSVATKDREMGQTATNFSPLGFQTYIFTKLDEAEISGSILNQIMRLNLPISYVTTGQNVPEDIEMARKARILDVLLGKK